MSRKTRTATQMEGGREKREGGEEEKQEVAGGSE
jgi:hypothetical protein